MADILIVDDDRDLAETVGDVLCTVGHRIRIAASGYEGLVALDQRLPDVVLLDVDMPELDGPGMAREMFLRDVGRELIPIVLCSANVDLPTVARRIGTRYLLPKPSPLDDLLAVMELALLERDPPRPAERCA